MPANLSYLLWLPAFRPALTIGHMPLRITDTMPNNHWNHILETTVRHVRFRR
jgi:hypothetical protein